MEGVGSAVTLDFGKDVGGILSFSIGNTGSNQKTSLNVSYSESSLYAGQYNDDVGDQIVAFDYFLAPHTFFTVPDKDQRGGFRYLTFYLTSPGPIEIYNISIYSNWCIHKKNLRDYSGFFYSEDNLINRLWYGGAYTVQMCSILGDRGGGGNSGHMGVSPILTDGAKRDRFIWPGDMGISVHTQFVTALEDLVSTKNSLVALFEAQSPGGELPYVGAPINAMASDTYHGWALIGLYNYYLYTGDSSFLDRFWFNYLLGVQFLDKKVNTDVGLLYVTKSSDWGRPNTLGFNAEANAIYYKILVNTHKLAVILGEDDTAKKYEKLAEKLKLSFFVNLWDETEGMFMDNTNSYMFPQDGNSLALLHGLMKDPIRMKRVSAGLKKNWGKFGAVCPEIPNIIAPFIGGFELGAHFEAGEEKRAMELMRLQWGYMVNTNISVQSTFLEGYYSDGSLRYLWRGPNYTSHAHGWSTAPTWILTFYVVGINVETTSGAKWTFKPRPADLKRAKGGFETSLGRYDAEWKLSGNSFSAILSVPQTSYGTVSLPVFKYNKFVLKVDGVVRSDVQVDGEFATLSKPIKGGSHTFSIIYSSVI
eukprot:TRINITY_DN4973_c0_g1_i1.p1 TRINITY_DN4973_c0_g1~~TRINITY_DN4973_c0_g1_i1.p1  ORF type:complete len:670 (-),score=152.07 TRINITY_DN4973_c0_g1_i1:233-1999(-)